MIRFAHIEFFWALLLLFFLLFLYWYYNKWKKKAQHIIGDDKTVERLIEQRSYSKPLMKFILLVLAFIFLVIGIVDPRIGSKLEKVKREGIDIFIALDVSNSMLAEDIKPNRLERAKMAISNLIDKLEGDRIGIVVFAGNAYKQLPLTTDYGAAKLFLSAIDTRIVPSQGTAIGAAINLAASSFDNDKHNKAIVIITDGENHEDDAVGAAKAAAEKGIKVFTIGMGLPEGAPIPIKDKYGNRSGFKKDQKGSTVITKLNEEMLQKIAAAGNGSYARANNAGVGLTKIYNDINKIQKKEIETKQFTDYEDRFQIYLALALLFLILEVMVSERKSKWADKFNIFGKQ
jgi:Ca-activated chloride channel family protein